MSDGDTTDWKAEAEHWKRKARQNEDRSKANHARIQEQDAELAVLRAALGKTDAPTPIALEDVILALAAAARRLAGTRSGP